MRLFDERTPGMDRRRLLAAMMGLTAGLVACSKDDPQRALEAAVQQLQDRIEARDTGAVMALLDERFRAQDEHDADWARKTMALVFLRHARVGVTVVTSDIHLDPVSPHIGRATAQVLLTGAQGLIPERMTPYAVEMVWRRDGADWKLRDLRWE